MLEMEEARRTEVADREGLRRDVWTVLDGEA
jgi:hypothetical protein